MKVRLPFSALISLGYRYVNYLVLQYRLATSVYREVTVAQGRLKGRKRLTVYDDNDYYAFEGIPYAQPPVGNLRFRAPQPAEPWEGVLDCTSVRNKPLQKDMIKMLCLGSEDCLYLNVYTKKFDTDKPLPVMVWIYGGGFQNGEASREFYGPDYLMSKDVILVTLNYRVGAFGFISFKDPDVGVPGNAGLKDQLMALRWVKENIANFNGDPENITLFGESAGGASTHLQMLTQKSKGLFHKAILQSGTALCPWSIPPPGPMNYRLAKRLGYKGSDNEKEVYRFLANADAQKIANNSNEILTREDYKNHFLFSFAPVVEAYDTEDTFISSSSMELMRTTWSNDIPILIGGNSFEGLLEFQHIKEHPYTVDELGDCSHVVPKEVRPFYTEEEIQKMGEQLRMAYFKGKTPNMKDNFFDYMNMVSHEIFWHSIHRTVLSRQHNAKTAPTYVYRFDFDSATCNYYRILLAGRQVRGVCHADEIGYLFHTVLSEKLCKDSMEYKTIERMIDMWYSFAATSNPNCPSIADTVWQPVHESPGKCLNISTNVSFVDLPEAEMMRLWDGFYVKAELY